MKRCKIVGKVAVGFGIVFAVFTVLAAFLQYETLVFTNYVATAPSGFIQVVILTNMLPYLMLSVLSFLVAVLVRGKEDSVEDVVEEESSVVESDVGGDAGEDRG